MTALNSPLETGIRVLMLLSETFPVALDINRLVLLDHCLLHSEDVGGPPSLYPPLPIRAGELGLKRQLLNDGLRVMLNAQLVTISAPTEGIHFLASEAAPGFIDLLESPYAQVLQERAVWAVSTLGHLSDSDLRIQLRAAFSHWTEEFLPLEQDNSIP